MVKAQTRTERHLRYPIKVQHIFKFYLGYVLGELNKVLSFIKMKHHREPQNGERS